MSAASAQGFLYRMQYAGPTLFPQCRIVVSIKKDASLKRGVLFMSAGFSGAKTGRTTIESIVFFPDLKNKAQNTG